VGGISSPKRNSCSSVNHEAKKKKKEAEKESENASPSHFHKRQAAE
jgi:hypothetical protein